MSSIHARLAPPPRRVPLSLRVTSVFGGLAQIGWFVFGFGSIFFWVFAMNADFSALTRWGSRLQAEGTVQRVEQTGASENETPIVAAHYEFSVAGQPFSGVSYTSQHDVQTGQKVTVEYRDGEPADSRIAGMRRKMFSPWASLVTIFPLIGLLIVVFTVRSGLKRNSLLATGILRKTDDGTYTDRVMRLASMMNIPEGDVEKMKDQFKQQFSRQSNKPVWTLYDPQQGSRTCSFSPSECDESGELRGSAGRAVMALLVPMIVLTANTLPILNRLGIDWWSPVKDAAVSALEQMFQ